MTFLTILGNTQILCSFKLVLEEKSGKKMPESSRFEFLEKFSASNFAFSDAEDNTSGPLNRRGFCKIKKFIKRNLLKIFDLPFSQ